MRRMRVWGKPMRGQAMRRVVEVSVVMLRVVMLGMRGGGFKHGQGCI